MRINSSNRDRAVSPVIGVILMVAITVILAAVIGTFVLGLGDNLEQTPSASASITDIELADGTSLDGKTDEITVEHRGGDSLNAEETTLLVRYEGESIRFAASTGKEGETFRTGDRMTVSLEIADAATDSDRSSNDLSYNNATNTSKLVIGTTDFNTDSEDNNQTLIIQSGDKVEVLLIHEGTGDTIARDNVTA